jgi:hypothetical protein
MARSEAYWEGYYAAEADYEDGANPEEMYERCTVLFRKAKRGHAKDYYRGRLDMLKECVKEKGGVA